MSQFVKTESLIASRSSL